MYSESVQMTRFVLLAERSLMASSSVLLAINFLSSDGMVRLGTNEHAQFEALVKDYFNNSDDVSDDDTSGSDDQMECGKNKSTLLL